MIRVSETLETIRDALILQRARLMAGEYGSLEDALTEYEQATGVKIAVDDLLAEIGQDKPES